MTKVATMGTSSCATIALQSFKNGQSCLGPFNNYEENEKYLADPEAYTPPKQGIDWFYNSILYPTEQELGRTDEMPLSYILNQMDKSWMRNKFIICTLNNKQYNWKDGYWANLLKEAGFEYLWRTTNDIGMDNHVLVRNKGKVSSSA